MPNSEMAEMRMILLRLKMPQAIRMNEYMPQSTVKPILYAAFVPV